MKSLLLVALFVTMEGFYRPPPPPPPAPPSAGRKATTGANRQSRSWHQTSSMHREHSNQMHCLFDNRLGEPTTLQQGPDQDMALAVTDPDDCFDMLKAVVVMLISYAPGAITGGVVPRSPDYVDVATMVETADKSTKSLEITRVLLALGIDAFTLTGFGQLCATSVRTKRVTTAELDKIRPRRRPTPAQHLAGTKQMTSRSTSRVVSVAIDNHPYFILPVVLHKAVAEVSKMENL